MKKYASECHKNFSQSLAKVLRYYMNLYDLIYVEPRRSLFTFTVGRNSQSKT